eukprot:jgi/Mesvir1/24123/Mv10840-RA.1
MPPKRKKNEDPSADRPSLSSYNVLSKRARGGDMPSMADFAAFMTSTMPVSQAVTPAQSTDVAGPSTTLGTAEKGQLDTGRTLEGTPLRMLWHRSRGTVEVTVPHPRTGAQLLFLKSGVDIENPNNRVIHSFYSRASPHSDPLKYQPTDEETIAMKGLGKLAMKTFAGLVREVAPNSTISLVTRSDSRLPPPPTYTDPEEARRYLSGFKDALTRMLVATTPRGDPFITQQANVVSQGRNLVSYYKSLGFEEVDPEQGTLATMIGTPQSVYQKSSEEWEKLSGGHGTSQARAGRKRGVPVRHKHNITLRRHVDQLARCMRVTRNGNLCKNRRAVGSAVCAVHRSSSINFKRRHRSPFS